ncbi:hypothetical protein ACUOA8_59740, partial [Escherichia sp. SS-MK2]
MSNIEDFETMQEEYFSFLEEQRQKGNNGIVRNKYLVFSITDLVFLTLRFSFIIFLSAATLTFLFDTLKYLFCGF